MNGSVLSLNVAFLRVWDMKMIPLRRYYLCFVVRCKVGSDD
jgi:hypothetical protein